MPNNELIRRNLSFGRYPTQKSTKNINDVLQVTDQKEEFS